MPTHLLSGCSFVTSLYELFQFLNCLAHVFLQRFVPQRSVISEDTALHFVFTALQLCLESHSRPAQRWSTQP